MSDSGISDWRHERKQSVDAQPLLWWLLLVSLLKKPKPLTESDIVPVAVPQYVDTVPVDRPVS